MPGAKRSILINASIERVFAAITDYDHYTEFLPEVKKVHSSGRQGPDVLVHYELKLVKTIKYTLKMHEEAPHRITWSFVEGEVMKDNRGQWRLEARGPAQTEATYEIEMALGALVPRALVNGLVDQSLPRMLEAFKKRSEQSA